LLDISLTISPIRDAHGRVIGASKIARDITAWKKTQEERAAKEALARLNEDLERRVGERTASLNGAIAQLEEFSYTVSHDLRAPARVMRAYAEIVLTEHGDELKPQVKDYLERIARGGARMDRLVQDTLTYSRLARRELTFHSIEPERLILDIISQYPEMALPRAAITIHRPLQPVEAHEPSLTQAISNLLSNAVKFVPVGEIPHVLIRTEKRATGVRLWVEDNGIGIPPAYLNRAFGVFERLHPDSCYEGTGIGLAIVRKVVERMDGTVGVESDGLTGSRFWIELPPAKNHGPTISNPSSR
jgi:signal transduction histidine kinase